MAKVTKANGPSFTDEELRDPTPPSVIIRRVELGGARPSDGSNSAVSTEKPLTENGSVVENHPSPALTTENPSGRPMEGELSGADSMGGHGQTTEKVSSRRLGRRTATKGKEASAPDDFNF